MLVYQRVYCPRIWSIVSYHPCPHPYEYHPIKHLLGAPPQVSSGLMLGSTLLANLGWTSWQTGTGQPQKCDGLRLQRSPKLQQIRKKSLINQTIGLLFHTFSRSCDGLCPKKDIPKSQRSSSNGVVLRSSGCHRGAEKAALMLMASGDVGRSCISSDAEFRWWMSQQELIFYWCRTWSVLISSYNLVSDIKERIRFKMIRHFVEMLIYPLNPLYLHNAALHGEF